MGQARESLAGAVSRRPFGASVPAVGTPPSRQPGQVNSQDVWRRNQAQFLGQGSGTGCERDPGGEWCAFAMFSRQSFETLEALILGPSDFVPKLTGCETPLLRIDVSTA
jgi:hypothetical protein